MRLTLVATLHLVVAVHSPMLIIKHIRRNASDSCLSTSLLHYWLHYNVYFLFTCL